MAMVILMKRVYVFDMDNDLVKIGIAQDVKQRISGVEHASGFAVVHHYETELFPNKLAREIERALHGYFNDYRTHGEFFAISFEEACSVLVEKARRCGDWNISDCDENEWSKIDLDADRECDGDDEYNGEDDEFDTAEYANFDSIRYRRLAESVVTQQLKVFVKQFCEFKKNWFVTEKDFLKDFASWFNSHNRRYHLFGSRDPLRICDTFRVKLSGHFWTHNAMKIFEGIRVRHSEDLGICYVGLAWKEGTPRAEIFQQQRNTVAAFLNRIKNEQQEGVMFGLLSKFVDEGVRNNFRFPGKCCCKPEDFFSPKGADGYDFFRSFCRYAEERLTELCGYKILAGDDSDSFQVETICVASYEYELDYVYVPFLDLVRKLGSFKILQHKGYQDFQYADGQNK